ncbi:MAG: thiol-disulfide oxidoreductase DCC family protein [Synechococcus sp.]
MSQQRRSDLTLLFDGGCPLCLREVNFLRRRDRSQRLSFVDINAIDYNASEHANISYRQAMGRIHAIRGTGEILTDVAVFREAYRLIGLGWLYAPTAWPVLAPVIDWVYGLWADWRLRLTGRPSLDTLCEDRCVPRSVRPEMVDADTSL